MARRLSSTPARRILRSAALLIIIPLMLGAITRLTGSAERLAYWPTREPFDTPPAFEDVSFKTPDGLTLHAWFMPAQGRSPGERAPCVLHCHGNAGNISHHAPFSDFLPDRGISVLLFDYRSYGRSDKGTLRRDSLLTDTRAALDYLLTRDDVDHDRIGALGVSLGAAFSLPLAAERDEIKAICTIGAFSRWRAVAGDWMPLVGPLVFPGGLDPIDAIASLADTPWLIVHGDDDKVINHRHAVLLHDAATSADLDARLLTVSGGDHNYLLETSPSAKAAIADFFREQLAPPDAQKPDERSDEGP